MNEIGKPHEQLKWAPVTAFLHLRLKVMVMVKGELYPLQQARATIKLKFLLPDTRYIVLATGIYRRDAATKNINRERTVYFTLQTLFCFRSSHYLFL